MRKFFKFVLVSLSLLFLLGIGGAVAVLYALWHFGRDLPDYAQLAVYQPPVATRVHAGDGRILAEYAVEKRVFVPVSAIPRRVIDAFLSAEDKSFYAHQGVNPLAILRAAVTNLKNIADRKRMVGASTITQQVAKNFLLTNEVSIQRKVREAILAFRIEKAYSKDHILELYLNEIYLGQGAYGVGAAAVTYFNKSLDELTVAEAAYLAALPKAPNNYHPVRNYEAAKARRDWVIERMAEDGFITPEQMKRHQAEALSVRTRLSGETVQGADHFAEEVRREIAKKFGEQSLYKGGLSVRTSLDVRLQEIADRTLRAGILAYDRRHGWRGPVARIEADEIWQKRLQTVAKPAGMEPWEIALVLRLGDSGAEVGLADGKKGVIPFAEMKWARPALDDQKVGPSPKSPADVLKIGDVVLVEAIERGDDGTLYAKGAFALRQSPKVDGALVAMDPHTGRVLAMSGGFTYQRSQFNRATQALRQPGSSFKPFIYLAALDQGYTPSTLILDAPFVIDQGPGLPKWKPENYSQEFYGPSTMRLGIEKSRNLMTVRLAQTLGMDKVADYAARFGINDHVQPVLSMSLGAAETTLLKLTAAYGMIVNGGRFVQPSLIDRIQDRHGKTVFKHDTRPCPDCLADSWRDQPEPRIPDTRPRIVDEASAYQMVSMLEGVIHRGTGTSVAVVGKPLAGKTGTSNDFRDAWFVGFSPDLAVGVFIGFDEPSTLGSRETGGAVAAPVFRDFMKEALKEKPAQPFRIPPGIRLVRVNAKTGLLAHVGERDVILEAFKPDHMPSSDSDVLEGIGAADLSNDGIAPPTRTGGETGVKAGGLY